MREVHKWRCYQDALARLVVWQSPAVRHTLSIHHVSILAELLYRQRVINALIQRSNICPLPVARCFQQVLPERWMPERIEPRCPAPDYLVDLLLPWSLSLHDVDARHYVVEGAERSAGP